MKQEAKRRFNMEEGHDSDSPPHFYRWLQEEANDLAARAGFSPPYPHVKALRDDNGEKFLYEYYVAQLKREEEPGWQEAFANGQKPTRCPCQACLQRRKQCKCQRCKAWRGTKEGMAALGIPVTFLLGATLTPIQPLWPLGARADGCASTDDRTGTGGTPIRNRTAHGATVVP